MTTKPMKMTTEAFAQFIARFGSEPGSATQMDLLVRVLNAAANSGIVDLIPTAEPTADDLARSAAPDLLAVCKSIARDLELGKGPMLSQRHRDAIRAAIARAEGGAA